MYRNAFIQCHLLYLPSTTPTLTTPIPQQGPTPCVPTYQEVEHDMHVQVPVSHLYSSVVQQPTQQLCQRLNECHTSLLLHLGVVLTPLRQPVGRQWEDGTEKNNKTRLEIGDIN